MVTPSGLHNPGAQYLWPVKEPASIRVLVADDHPVYIDGLAAAINRADDRAIRLRVEGKRTSPPHRRRLYLDPALRWNGCKETGRGAALSHLGYLSVTRPKSYHLRKH